MLVSFSFLLLSPNTPFHETAFPIKEPPPPFHSAPFLVLRLIGWLRFSFADHARLATFFMIRTPSAAARPLCIVFHNRTSPNRISRFRLAAHHPPFPCVPPFSPHPLGIDAWGRIATFSNTAPCEAWFFCPCTSPFSFPHSLFVPAILLRATD